MANHPGILILDEPCSGLDMPAREDLLNALEKLAGTGTRIVMVTHHPEDLIPSITHLLVMEKGRILDKGRKEKILSKKSLSYLFDDLNQSPSPSGADLMRIRARARDRSLRPISPDPFHDHRDTLSPADAEGGQT